MKTSEILDAAADRIQVGGLWQGQIGSGGSTCTANAIFKTVGRIGSAAEPARCEVAAYLGLPIGGHAMLDAIFDWNDAPERTAEQVIATLRAAALIAAAKETAPSQVARVGGRA